MRLWTLDGKPAAQPFKGHDGWVWSVAFAPDGTRIVSGGSDGTVRLWTLDGKPAAQPFKGHDGRVYSVAFAPDGTRIVSGGSDGTVRLWTLDGKPAAQPFKGHDGWVYSVAFAPDGTRIVSGGSDGTVRLWTLDGKPAAQPFKGHDGLVYSVAFAPDGTRIVSGGSDGTVRLWTLDGKPAAQPFKGHDGWVFSVAFAPDGTRIVSGGSDGTVRLWTLDGKPAAAAQPFKGHDGWVWSVAFAPDGTRIVSGGSDGTVRLWTLTTRTYSSTVSLGRATALGFLSTGQFWLRYSDRIVLQNGSFRPRGEIFLTKEGLIASVYSEGIYVPNDRMGSPFRAITEDGSVDWSRRAVPEISLKRVRQVLLDEWTLSERIREIAKQTYSTLEAWYQSLGWLKVPFWPALGWFVAIAVAIGMWIFAPHKLATWAMPRLGSADIPIYDWKWVAGVLTLFGFLGTTHRALRAWVRKNRDALHDQNFAYRTPVKEREKYCVLTHQGEIAAFVRDLGSVNGARVWIDGVGGSGKSALSFQMVRAASGADPSAPIPILVDEDWNGPLVNHVAQLLRLGNRVPTKTMVEVLGSRGDVCPVIDSLSERGMPDAVERIANAVGSGAFKSVIVSSRQPAPNGKTWQGFTSMTAVPLTAAQAPEYVATYAPKDSRAQVLDRIAPLIADKQSISPLFLRFAVEQALTGPVASTSTLISFCSTLKRFAQGNSTSAPTTCCALRPLPLAKRCAKALCLARSSSLICAASW